jgi:hypothetical protein
MTCNDNNYNFLASITAPTKKEYAEKWGFVFEHVKLQGNMHPAWEKARVTARMLEKYDGVLYIDCDAAIINQNFDFRPYIEKHDFIISTDVNGINAGVYYAKSTPLVKQFFFAVNTWGPMFYGGHPWNDQEAMKYYLANPPYNHLATYMPQNFMNSYIHEGFNYTNHPFPDYIQGNYQPGDWIIHLPGMPMEVRVRYLQEKITKGKNQ